VRVEDVCVLGKLATQLFVPLRHQLLGSLKRVGHSSESMYGGSPDVSYHPGVGR
jgi:hypothetical protein